MIEPRNRGGVMRTGHYLFVAAVGIVAVVVAFAVFSTVVGIVFAIVKIAIIAAVVLAALWAVSRMARRRR